MSKNTITTTATFMAVGKDVTPPQPFNALFTPVQVPLEITKGATIKVTSNLVFDGDGNQTAEKHTCDTCGKEYKTLNGAVKHCQSNHQFIQSTVEMS